MALTNWNDILNKPKGIDEVPEIALTVEQLSASVLSISEDVGEIALDVSQLSASVLSIAGEVNEKSNKFTYIGDLTTGTVQAIPAGTTEIMLTAFNSAKNAVLGSIVIEEQATAPTEYYIPVYGGVQSAASTLLVTRSSNVLSTTHANKISLYYK